MTRSALIVAHGQPSDPAPPEAEMAELARNVAALLPGWKVGSATLADQDSLLRTLSKLDAPVVFPFFMSDGWFIKTMLPRRLASAGATDLRVLTPFGLLPATEALAIRIVRDAATTRGWTQPDTTLILASHGSGASRQPAATATAMRDRIVEATAFREVRLGFIEEPPYVADVLQDAGSHALLLPLFVARWGHVEQDLPQAISETGFTGAFLAPLGTYPDVPEIIAEAIRSLR